MSFFRPVVRFGYLPISRNLMCQSMCYGVNLLPNELLIFRFSPHLFSVCLGTGASWKRSGQTAWRTLCTYVCGFSCSDNNFAAGSCFNWIAGSYLLRGTVVCSISIQRKLEYREWGEILVLVGRGLISISSKLMSKNCFQFWNPAFDPAGRGGGGAGDWVRGISVA